MKTWSTIASAALLLPLVIILPNGGQSFTPSSIVDRFTSQLNTNKDRSPITTLSVATSREIEITNSAIDYSSMTTLPRHPNNDEANDILTQTEEALRSMQVDKLFSPANADGSAKGEGINGEGTDEKMEDIEIPVDVEQESVYANSYVDLGKVDTVGFDFDYTLVTYTKELLELIYDMALTRLVEEKEYPREMLTSGLKFDPFFSIRGEFICTVYFHMLL